MSEWRGPWKCEKCGNIWMSNRTGSCPQSFGPFTPSALPTECGGKLHPYERRKDDALAAMTRERDEWKDAKHRCEDLAEEHIQRIESLERERDAMREYVEEVAGFDCDKTSKHFGAKPCGHCVPCRARAALKEGESK